MSRKPRIERYCPDCGSKMQLSSTTGRYSCTNPDCDISYARFNRNGSIKKVIRVSVK